MKTLFQEVTGWMYFQQSKHDHLQVQYPDEYPEQLVNEMSNFKLLKVISDYLEEKDNVPQSK